MDFLAKRLGSLFAPIARFFGADVAVDLGTANTLIFVKGEGVLLNEPSFVAVDTETGKVQAIGREAKDMWGRAPQRINVIRPINDGVVDNYDAALLMLRDFLNRVSGRIRLVKPRMVICVPSKITQVEKRAVIDLGMECGAREVLLLDEPMAAAIGCELPVNEPRGCMVVDIGGGTTDVALISMGGIAVKDSVRVAGYEIDEAINAKIREKYHIKIGILEAERIKIEIGTVTPGEGRSMMVTGIDLARGTPKTVEITSDEVREYIMEPVNVIVDAVRQVLDSASPELVSDVAKRGILLTGGGSLLRGLDRFMEQKLMVKVYRAEEPLLSVVLGAGKALEEFDTYRRAFLA